MVAAPSTLALLNEELEQIRRDREALRTKHPGQTMPEEARAEDVELVRRNGRVIAAIEVEQQKMRDAEFQNTARYMDEPQLQVKHPVNADDESRKVLMRAGWDIRSGMIYRRTSLGEVAFLPEDVLFGPVPRESDDAVAAQHYREMRATFQPEYGAAFRKWVRNRGHRDILTGAEQAALSEGVAEGGGYLVPPDVAAEILARRARASVMRSLCSIRQTSRDRLIYPAVAPAATNGSIYSSGFVGGLVGETPSSNTDTGPTFQQFEISIKDFEAYTKISNNLIADASSDVMAFLATDGGRNLGLVEDYYFLLGDGAGLQPLGLLNGGSSTFDVEGATSNTLDNSVSNAGSAPKIIAGFYELPQQYADAATWLVSRATQGLIHALVDGDGRPWWQAAASSGGTAGAPPVLVGAPLRTSAWMPEDGTNANKVMVIGDFSQYIIAERQGISVTVDDINLVASKQTQIFIRSRAGGGVWNTDAFRFGVV